MMSRKQNPKEMSHHFRVRGHSVTRELPTPYRSEFPLDSHLGGRQSNPSLAMSRRRMPSNDYDSGASNTPMAQSPGGVSNYPTYRHKDLKRKMVFHLHTEINKSIHTITLEELSDMDRITEMCMGTLRSMMNHKTHRRYLHHMNNSNSIPQMYYCPYLEGVDKSTNAATKAEMDKLRRPGASSDGKDGVRRPSGRPFTNKNKLPDAIAKNMKRQDEAFKRAAAFQEDPNFERTFNAGLPMFGGPGSERTSWSGGRRSHGLSEKISFSIQDPYSIRLDFVEEDEEPVRSTETASYIRHSQLMTPREALNCKYLRLSQGQIAELEAMIRAQGEEPGVHAHSTVDFHDVFAEIREIRQQEAQTQQRKSRKSSVHG